MWGANRYIYIGLSNNYHTYKDASTWGINFSKNNASYELLKPTDINATHNDGQRDYHMYRVLVSEDKNQAEFKGNDSWWKSKSSVTLNGTTQVRMDGRDVSKVITKSHLLRHWQQAALLWRSEQM